MDDTELRELALKLAKEAGVDAQMRFYQEDIDAIVRAAVAHGLRIGAKHFSESDYMMYRYEVAATLRAKADEMERQK